MVLVLLVGVWAQVNVLRPQCDSAEAEEAALVAQDYLNSQHTHGYKYALNRIEDIKIITKVSQAVQSSYSYRNVFSCDNMLITFVSSWPLDSRIIQCERLNTGPCNECASLYDGDATPCTVLSFFLCGKQCTYCRILSKKIML